jgi:hypothetical protein
MPPRLLIGALLLVGSFAFFRWAMNRMFAEEKARSRSPFKEKLLRPAGEGLRLRIEEIRDEIMERGLVLVTALVAPILVIVATDTRSWALNVIIGSLVSVVGYGAAFWQWRKVKGLRNELRNSRLGFDGERYVAEKLSTLSSQGYRIYHDFVFDMKPGGEASTFNIDHIVIGTTGVFALETKTYRQPNGELPEGHESYKVTASSDHLHLPKGYRTAKPMAQARRNAEDLSAWLSGSSPEKVPVVPVVVMPGWYVTDDKSGKVRVLSGKPVATLLPYLGKEGTLNDAKVRSLADRIEAHCRNVEGA